MDNKNPVFARLDQQTSTGGSGFAYTEGMAAYQQAGQQPYPPQYAPAPGAPTGSIYEPVTDRMSLDDVIVRTGISLAVLIPFAWIGWMVTPSMPWLYVVAMLAGLGLGLVNTFKKVVSPALVLAYAAVEGLFLGGISWAYSNWAAASGYEGNLVSQAVIGTLVAFVVMLALYKSRIVKVNGRFMKVMMVAMVSYLVIALASFVSALFGVGNGWGFYGVGGLGILLCVVGVGLASFSLMIDFESITQGVRAGLPQREAWRMSFGLLVTLIWLYLEILRLLALIAASRD
ncbi:MAG TPA: Bax inhibitor-1/YccA family protein [Candidatus Nanopelagicales bacterium]